jgi:diguanylate cyclase (GGDEF)-like protein
MAAAVVRSALDFLNDGVCLFDAEQRLALNNRRWCDLYHLRPEQTPRGATFRSIVELRAQSGACAPGLEAYLRFCDRIHRRREPARWTVNVDGVRRVDIRHQPMPGGGWLSIHRDLADARVARAEPERDVVQEILFGVVEAAALGAPLESVLESLVGLLEAQIGDARVTVLRTGIAADGQPVAVEPARPQARRAIREPLAPGDVEAMAGRGWNLALASPQGEALGAIVFEPQPRRQASDAERRMIADCGRVAALAIGRARLDEQLAGLAYRDPLTGLANRALLAERAEIAMAQARRDGRRVAVAYIDLDGFKPINDRLGHAGGDALLKVVAERLASCVRGGDTVARIGGDEFVALLVDQPKTIDDFGPRMQQLKSEISRPISLANRRCRVTASVGLAVFPDDGSDLPTLLDRADAAMYEAKRLRRSNGLAAPLQLGARPTAPASRQT